MQVTEAFNITLYRIFKGISMFYSILVEKVIYNGVFKCNYIIIIYFQLKRRWERLEVQVKRWWTFKHYYMVQL